MADTGIILIGCCLVIFCILAAIGGYLYKKGIRMNNIGVARCVFSSKPLVGTWTSANDKIKITSVDTTYTIVQTTLANVVQGTIEGSILEGNKLTTISTMGGVKITTTGIIDGTTLTVTNDEPVVIDPVTMKPAVRKPVVYTKTSC